ncbi:MAG: hypothetical protein M3P26_04480 [Gemmatimonadota bacterium]|nr:hypothetical protein [Gemmatimonadota bacterium]
MENELTADGKAYLERAFTYHAPKEGQPIKYGILRDKARELATEILRLCPDKNERICALINVEQAAMWANAAIARWG